MSPWRWAELKPEIPPKPQASAGWQLPATSSASQPGFGQVPNSSEYKWSIIHFIFFNNHCWVLPEQLLDGDPQADSAVRTRQGWSDHLFFKHCDIFFCQGKQRFSRFLILLHVKCLSRASSGCFRDDATQKQCSFPPHTGHTGRAELVAPRSSCAAAFWAQERGLRGRETCTQHGHLCSVHPPSPSSAYLITHVRY